MTEPVVASVRVNARPDVVFRYFTSAEGLVRWMGEYAVIEAEPEGQFTLDIRGVPVRGRFLAVEPPRRVLVSWGYAGSDRLAPGASTVEVRLTPDGDGTLVEVEHRDLPPEDASGHTRGWPHYLGRLRVVAEGGDAGPDPGHP